MADRFEPACTQNFTTVATLRGALTTERLERALRCLERRHPLLRARIDRVESDAKFVAGEAGEIPLCAVAARQEELPELIARTSSPVPGKTPATTPSSAGFGTRKSTPV